MSRVDSNLPANIVNWSMSWNSPYPFPLNAAQRSATKICALFRMRTLRLSKRVSSRKQAKCLAKRLTSLPAEWLAFEIRLITVRSGFGGVDECFSSVELSAVRFVVMLPFVSSCVLFAMASSPFRDVTCSLEGCGRSEGIESPFGILDGLSSW